MAAVTVEEEARPEPLDVFGSTGPAVWFPAPPRIADSAAAATRSCWRWLYVSMNMLATAETFTSQEEMV